MGKFIHIPKPISPADLENSISGALPESTINIFGSQTILNRITIDKPITINGGKFYLSGHSMIDAGDNNVTFNGTQFIADNKELLFQKADNYSWNFINCDFNGVKLSLRKTGRTGVDGNVVNNGTISATVAGCNIHNLQRAYGLEIAGWDNLLILNNHIFDVGIDENAGDGIKLLDGAFQNIIRGNVIERTTKDAIDGASSHENYFIENELSDFRSVGIDLKNNFAEIPNNASYGHVVDSNHIYDTGDGILIEGVFGHNVDDLTINNNRVYNTGNPPSSAGIYVNGANNIVTNNDINGWGVDLFIENPAENLNEDVLTSNTYETIVDNR